MAKTIKDDLSDRRTWTRLLYMILFAVIFNVAELVVVVVVVVQFISRLFTGKTIEELRGLGNTLGAYAHEIIAYLSYHSETRPYPFGPWPTPAPAPGAKKPAPAKRTRKPKQPSDAQPPEPQAADSAD